MSSVVGDRLVEVELVEAPVAQRAPVAAGKTFRAYDPGQVLLMAPCLQDWVPDGHLARFVSDLVDEAPTTARLRWPGMFTRDPPVPFRVRSGFERPPPTSSCKSRYWA
jgi:hypothetical protein